MIIILSKKIAIDFYKRRKLIEERKKRNWTQKVVVEQLKEYGVIINRDHLSKIETGINNPSILVLKSLVNLYQLSLNDLL